MPEKTTLVIEQALAPWGLEKVVAIQRWVGSGQMQAYYTAESHGFNAEAISLEPITMVDIVVPEDYCGCFP
jgi:hypothetical protein